MNYVIYFEKIILPQNVKLLFIIFTFFAHCFEMYVSFILQCCTDYMNPITLHFYVQQLSK